MRVTCATPSIVSCLNDWMPAKRPGSSAASMVTPSVVTSSEYPPGFWLPPSASTTFALSDVGNPVSSASGPAAVAPLRSRVPLPSICETGRGMTVAVFMVVPIGVGAQPPSSSVMTMRIAKRGIGTPSLSGVLTNSGSILAVPGGPALHPRSAASCRADLTLEFSHRNWRWMGNHQGANVAHSAVRLGRTDTLNHIRSSNRSTV